MYRGCAIPVAWTILPAGKKRAWRREWLRVGERVLRPALPPDWTVLVLADRGLYAHWLFRRIVRLGWHPYLRINQGRNFRPHDKAGFVGLCELVGQVGQRFRGRGMAFSSADCHLDCTLVAWWGEGHKEPWFVLTDLSPDGCDAQWYALCGWQWQLTQMKDPKRAERLWLAVAVATLWMLTIGTDMELGPDETCAELPDLSVLLGARATQRATTHTAGSSGLAVIYVVVLVTPVTANYFGLVTPGPQGPEWKVMRITLPLWFLSLRTI